MIYTIMITSLFLA